MLNKTFKQLNAERAARRARPIKKKQKKNKSTSPQAGGPAPDESHVRSRYNQKDPAPPPSAGPKPPDYRPAFRI